MRHPVICLCFCPADRAEYQSLIANRSTRCELVLSARNVSVSVEGHDIWAGIKRRLLRKCETIWVHATFRPLRSPVFKWVELFAVEPLIGNRLPGCLLRRPKFAMLQCAALPNSSVERLQATDRFSNFLRLPCRGVTVGSPLSVYCPSRRPSKSCPLVQHLRRDKTIHQPNSAMRRLVSCILSKAASSAARHAAPLSRASVHASPSAKGSS